MPRFMLGGEGWAVADLVIRNARVYTLDRAVPWAEAVAVAVHDGRICWKCANGDAGNLAGRARR